MIIADALLECWMREYYFDAQIDLGSSGVQSFSLAELRNILGIRQEELDGIVFQDSRTLGEERLRQAIANRWGNGFRDAVMVTHGSSEAIYLIMNALLRHGDEAVVMVPCYQQLYSIAESLGCKLRFWHLRSDQQFKPDVDGLKRLLSPRTRMVVVNFPHNPTGVSLSALDQERLISAVAEAGAYLVWDGAFADITYGSHPLPNPGGAYERSISIGTLSKAYGLPGLRVGWAMASPDVLAQFERLRDYITLHLSPLIELIALRAIEKADALLKIRLEHVKRNLEILTQWAAEHVGFVEWSRPQGGVCTFPRLCTVSNVEEFCRHLTLNQGVLLVPGSCFNHPMHVRLGFGTDTASFQEGLARLSYKLKDSVNTW
jgi:capreomycidine synthase